MAMSTILVPVDFSDITPLVVRQAADIARATGGSLTLLHVALPDPAFVGFETGPVVVQDAVERDYQEDHRRLEELRTGLAAQGIQVDYLHYEGSTAEVILREARRLPASIIVMGSHGHGALFHLLAGTATVAVLRKASCPVLVVPHSMMGKDA